MSQNFTGGTNFTWPTQGESGWASVVAAALQIISAHDHTGSGNGTQIAAGALASDSITGTKVRLANDQALRARNAAGDADVNLIKLTSGNLLSILTPLIFGSSETLTSSGALSLSTIVSVLNGSSLAMTLANGTEGQIKLVVNIASTTATATPATTSGANTVALFQHGVALYAYLGSEWRVLAGPKCVVTDDSLTHTSGDITSVTTRQILYNVAGNQALSATGVEGQELFILNINGSTRTITPSTSAGVNTAQLTTNGSVLYKWMSGEWRAFAGAGCTLS